MWMGIRSRTHGRSSAVRLGSISELFAGRSVKPTFVVDVAGAYIAQLVVNDGTVDSTPSTVSITTANTPPVANAGQSQSVNAGALVQLNGSGSTDVDGDPLTFRWSLVAVPADSAAVLSNTAAVNPTFTADKAGVYVAQLIVNDGKVDSKPSMVSIAINAVQVAHRERGAQSDRRPWRTGELERVLHGPPAPFLRLHVVPDHAAGR